MRNRLAFLRIEMQAHLTILFCYPSDIDSDRTNWTIQKYVIEESEVQLRLYRRQHGLDGITK